MKTEEVKTIHERMAEIKAELSKTKINKSGHNKYAGFKYHELSDFLQLINELNLKHGVNDFVSIDEMNQNCSITLVNVKDVNDQYTIITPFREAEMLGKGGAKSNVDAVQRMGSTITYNRRYLYMTAYNIQESDGVDAVEPQGSKTPTKPAPKALTNERFDAALKALEDGKTTEQAIRGYALTINQATTLNEFLKEK